MVEGEFGSWSDAPSSTVVPPLLSSDQIKVDSNQSEKTSSTLPPPLVVDASSETHDDLKLSLTDGITPPSNDHDVLGLTTTSDVPMNMNETKPSEFPIPLLPPPPPSPSPLAKSAQSLPEPTIPRPSASSDGLALPDDQRLSPKSIFRLAYQDSAISIDLSGESSATNSFPHNLSFFRKCCARNCPLLAPSISRWSPQIVWLIFECGIAGSGVRLSSQSLSIYFESKAKARLWLWRKWHRRFGPCFDIEKATHLWILENFGSMVSRANSYLLAHSGWPHILGRSVVGWWCEL